MSSLAIATALLEVKDKSSLNLVLHSGRLGTHATASNDTIAAVVKPRPNADEDCSVSELEEDDEHITPDFSLPTAQDNDDSLCRDDCPFLRLPQELRDVIFEYVLNDNICDSEIPSFQLRTKTVPVSNTKRWEWTAEYPALGLSPAYLGLLLSNRRLRDEVKALQNRPQSSKQLPARVTLLLAYPRFAPIETSVPALPSQIRELDVLVKIDYMYHPAYMTRDSQNAILAAVFDVIKRYVHRGPHLARPSLLATPLHLQTVRITVAPPAPFEEIAHVYGFPKQQLDSLYAPFHALVARLARSGLPYGHVDSLEVRMQGGEYERLPVTSNIIDEEDFLFFHFGGYRWDAGDKAVEDEPDLPPW